MKAHWTVDDIAGMARKPLSFDSSDVEPIRLGLGQKESPFGGSSDRTLGRAGSFSGARFWRKVGKLADCLINAGLPHPVMRPTLPSGRGWVTD